MLTATDLFGAGGLVGGGGGAFNPPDPAAATVAFVCGWEGDVVGAVDISGSPYSLLDTITGTAMTGASGLQYDAVNELVITGGGDTSSVAVIDVSDPSNLAVLGTWTHTGHPTTGWDCKRVALDVENRVAYFTADNVGVLTAIDYSDPSSMSMVGEIDAKDGTYGITLDLTNRIAYVGSDISSGVSAVDISDPANMSVIDTLATTELLCVTDLAVDVENGIMLCAAYDSDTFVLVDISDPANMARIDSHTWGTRGPQGVAMDPTTQTALGISSVNERLFSFTYGASLIDTGNMFLSATINTPRYIAWDRFTDTAYCTCADASKLCPIDVSNMGSMVEGTTFDAGTAIQGSIDVVLNSYGMEANDAL